ncbi:hypothetical protein C2S53_004357 [Perilla frutescens var. hirtella]|uniref:Uncharacterized protein n=1 Tax=Perilla frutescens var. hirtella TaxID=608512 RepID=A0AAD4INR7_PERFH|nr:hypothetical protein C2S53_004357 [Perilla frutescens var. hirtella]
MAKQNRSENRKTRSETRKALFSRGNISPDKRRYLARTSQRVQFNALCKTWEHKYRMNLPKEVINVCDKETRWVEIEIGYTGIRTEVVYQYREIKPNKPNCRLISGWKHVVEFLEIHQGNHVYFEGRPDMPWLLRVSRDKHPDAVKVEDEY